MKTMMEKDIQSLHDEINGARKALFDLRLSALVGQLKDVSQFKKLRRKIAQAKTAITTKQSA